MTNAAIDYSKTNEYTAQDRCVCISVEFRTYGTSRKVNMDKVEVDADKNRMHVSKQILDSDNLEAIKKIYRKTYGWLWTKCLPAPLRAGTYLLPIALIQEVEDKLKRTESEVEPFVKALVAEMPELKEADKRQLRSQYNEDDYPTDSELYDSFCIKSQYIDFRVPEKLKTITGSLYKREVEKQKEAWEETIESARDFLRETAAYLIEQFSRQLTVEKVKGKTKANKIYDSTIENLKQFAQDFDARNLADDDKLLVLVAKAKNAIEGIDADALRENDRLRARIAAEMEAVKDQVVALVRPVRAIELE